MYCGKSNIIVIISFFYDTKTNLWPLLQTSNTKFFYLILYKNINYEWETIEWKTIERERLNGKRLNGKRLNGKRLNGKLLNGKLLNRKTVK